MKLGALLLFIGWAFITAGIALAAWSHYYEWDRDTLGFSILLFSQGILPIIFGGAILDDEFKVEEHTRQIEYWNEQNQKRVS